MSNKIKGVKVNNVQYKFDYESLADKPFGEESRELYFPETEIEFIDDYSPRNLSEGLTSLSRSIPSQFRPVCGTPYIITFDNVEYPSVLEFRNPDYSGTSCDFKLETDIFTVFIYEYADIYLFVETPETSLKGYHTIKIERVVKNVMKPEYLPDELKYICSSTETIFNEASVQLTVDDPENPSAVIGSVKTDMYLEDDGLYILYVNNEKYPCRANTEINADNEECIRISASSGLGSTHIDCLENEPNQHTLYIAYMNQDWYNEGVPESYQISLRIERYKDGNLPLRTLPVFTDSNQNKVTLYEAVASLWQSVKSEQLTYDQYDEQFWETQYIR